MSTTPLHDHIAASFRRQQLLATLGARLARGKAARVGRTVGVATAEVVAQAAGKPDVCVALMQATMMRVEPRNGAEG